MGGNRRPKEITRDLGVANCVGILYGDVVMWKKHNQNTCICMRFDGRKYRFDLGGNDDSLYKKSSFRFNHYSIKILDSWGK